LSVLLVRPEMTTVAPSFWNSIAPARPMPEPPPVIQATLPFQVIPLGILGRSKQDFASLSVCGPWRRRSASTWTPFAPPGAPRSCRASASRSDTRRCSRPGAPGAQPRHGRHVGDGVLVAREDLRFLRAARQTPYRRLASFL
jgi:hypothetical protein